MKFYRNQKYLINTDTQAIFVYQPEIAKMKNIRDYQPEVYEEDKAETPAKSRKKTAEGEGV